MAQKVKFAISNPGAPAGERQIKVIFSEDHGLGRLNKENPAEVSFAKKDGTPVNLVVAGSVASESHNSGGAFLDLHKVLSAGNVVVKDAEVVKSAPIQGKKKGGTSFEVEGEDLF